MDGASRPPGRTQDFVSARGFGRVGDLDVLFDRDSRGRFFLELMTDADHPRSDPVSAYENLLSTMEPGAQVRFLQIFWPDDRPRAEFSRQAEAWPPAPPGLLAELKTGLTGYLANAPLPFLRRTILEIVTSNAEMADWIGGAVELLKADGLNARPLPPAEVQELARWFFNPVLD
jgi:hypothetical protein